MQRRRRSPPGGHGPVNWWQKRSGAIAAQKQAAFPTLIPPRWWEEGRDVAIFMGFVSMKSSQVKVCYSRRQESHMQRRRARLAQELVCAGVVSTTPPVSRKTPARDVSSFGCVVQTRQFLFVFSLRCVGLSRCSVLKFLFEGSW